MEFWDYCVRDDAEKPALEEMAQKLGWKGLCTFGDNVKSQKGVVEISVGALVETKNINEMKKKVRSARKSSEIVAVTGLSDEMNRLACDTQEVDMLLPKPQTKIDIVMAKLARENEVSICFEFGTVLHSSMEERGQVFSQMIKNAKAVRKSKAPFVIVSGASSEFGLRSHSELIAFGKLLGFGESEIKRSMSADMINSNRKKLSGKFVIPGVEVEK